MGVAYLPPAQDLMLEIMAEVMAFANNTDAGLDPLVRGALASFAFVSARPFLCGRQWPVVALSVSKSRLRQRPAAKRPGPAHFGGHEAQ